MQHVGKVELRGNLHNPERAHRVRLYMDKAILLELQLQRSRFDHQGKEVDTLIAKGNRG